MKKASAVAHLVLAVLATGGLLVAAPAQAEVPDVEAMRRACKPGTDAHEPGGEDYPGGLWKGGYAVTPVRLPGATTVSVREVKCLLEKFAKQVLVLAAVDDAQKLPGAAVAAAAASADDSGDLQKRFAEALARATDGNKGYPLVVYCHHVRCFLSYNVALRAVNAGYTSVYWMRPGLAGWRAAGYPLEGPPPEPPKPAVEQGLTERYLKEVRTCDELYFDHDADDFTLKAVQFESAAELEASWAKDIAEKKEERRSCLASRKKPFAENAPALADLTARLARSDAEVEQKWRQVRSEVEANAQKHFGAWLEAQELPKLRKQLQLAREMKTTAQLCGTFDYAMPPLDNDVIQARSRRRREYGDCITKWNEDSSFALAEVEFSGAVEVAQATQRYTCSARKVPNCLSDSDWSELAAIATPANLAIIKRADEIYSSRYTVYREEVERLNKWIEDVNERVERYNAAN